MIWANRGKTEADETSDDCLYFVNLLLFLHSALTYPQEMRIALMKEIALNAVAKWAQMEAKETLSPFCSYLKLDPLEKVPAYVHVLGGSPPDDKFPIVDRLAIPAQTETAIREAFQYSIRGFNNVIPSGGEDGYMNKILNYLKLSYGLEEGAVTDRKFKFIAEGNLWSENQPRRAAARLTDDDSEPSANRR